MNPTTEYNANPLFEKVLLKYVAIYKLEEAILPPSDIALPPKLKLIADLSTGYDYRYASYMSTIYRAVREIQHRAEIDDKKEKNNRASKLQNDQNGEKLPEQTHRVRLSHEEYEIHCQTIILPDIDVHDGDYNNVDESDGEIDDNLCNYNDDQGVSSRFDKKSPNKATNETKTNQKGQKGQKGQKNKNKLANEIPMATYILAVSTDFNFVIDYSISAFFRDFTTQLSYIFNPKAIQNEKSHTKHSSPVNTSSLPTLHDKRFFVLLAQLFNRYVKSRKNLIAAKEFYGKTIKLQKEAETQSGTKIVENKSQELKQASSPFPNEPDSDPITSHNGDKNNVENNQNVENNNNPNKKDKQNHENNRGKFPLPELTLFTTVHDINYPSIDKNPRILHIETISDDESLQYVNYPQNTPELLQFVSKLIFEHQFIKMDQNNVCETLKGITHFFGIPVRIVNNLIVYSIQLVTMAIVFYIMYWFGMEHGTA
jgi:phage shock protein PspC (stress-responsive transcriptional regulator)